MTSGRVSSSGVTTRWSVSRAFGSTLTLALAASLALASAPASAVVEHELITKFHEVPESQVIITDAVDNSGGPSNGDIYVGEFSFGTGSAIEKLNEDGTPTGVRITGSETPQSSFSFLSFSSFNVSGIAVDSSAGANRGDLYVADIEHGVIDKFSEAGLYVCQITGGATPSSSECNGAAGSDTPDHSISPAGVAVDASGDLYVSDTAHHLVDEFGPSGNYLSQIVDTHITRPGQLALDSTGDLYLANSQPFVGAENVVKFDKSGQFVSVLDSNTPGGVAVSGFAGSSDHVVVNETSPQAEIAEYDAANNLFTTFAEGLSVISMAFNDSTGDVYATVQTSVYVYGPPVVAPSTTTEAATGVHTTSATLNGRVEPDLAHGGGDVTSCEFEYGTSTSYGQSAACVPATPYSTTTSVSADVSLLPSTEYHFRLSATDSGGTSTGGTNHGEDMTVTTFGPPGVDSESSSRVVISSATVSARVNPFGFDTKCEVEYIEDARFAASGYAGASKLPCGPADLGSGFGDQSVSVSLSGLAIDTSYHYRFVASNSAGTTLGADETFATFGVKSLSIAALDQQKQIYTAAGGHPYELTTSFTLNTTVDADGRPDSTDANPRDIRTELPPGLIGNPDATPKCSSYNVAHADCSGSTQVGILKVFTANGVSTESPIYNLVPPKGMAAQFGARFNGFVTAHINASVRTGGDYGVTADALYISADEGLTGATVTFWGVPADPSHDEERYCPVEGKINEEFPCHERGAPVPFLTNPTSCDGPQTARLGVDSWQEPGVFVWADDQMPAITGCEKVDFNPTITVEPTSDSIDSPTGLHVDMRVLQNEDPNGLKEADLKDATVTLPVGVTVDPSSASGMVGCPLLTGKQGHPGVPGIDLENGEPANCPNASKVGKVTIKTPLLEEELTGGVYVAQQNANPFNSLLALYIAAEARERGIVVKLAGRVSLEREESNGVVTKEAGQLTTSFDENPQLPFETLKFDFFGGERASLATPRSCGSYQPTSVFEPWSHQSAPGEKTGTPNAEPVITPFEITSGIGGAPCSSVGGFTPGFVAGTQSNAASSFSPFVMNLTRKDGEQVLRTVALTMPLGLAGDVSAVTLCPEAQANAGTCPASSKIGHVRVSAGVGSEPIVLPEAGKPEDPVYLTESYKGAPFGLSVVVPAEAGPFNLDEGGRPIVVRAKVEINPYTAQVSVVSDPQPTELQGIPLDVRDIEVVVDKPGFMFNPTRCNPASVNGTIGSLEGASASVSSRFQAADCASLPFKPSFSALTNATHTRFGGDSLHVVVKSAQGQANLKEVHVELPKVLPSRLSTINLACPEAVFAANPATCPAGSRVGTVSAQTPLLSVPLVGPAYFVSHGGAKFPELIFILQGEGVTVQLNGETFISKSGITSSTFKTLPDVPVSRVDVVLPAGEDSVLTGEGDLCAHPLYMPTTLVGQNGSVIKERTRIGVEGCKPELIVLRHKVKGGTATIVVKTPFAGRLSASGKGLSRAVKRLGKPGVATVRLTLTKAERVLLARHRGRRLKVRVELRFTSGHGPVLTRAVSVLIG